MAKESYPIYIERENLPNGANHIKVDVFYCKGGRHWLTGDVFQRGYYVSVQHVCINDEVGYMSFNFPNEEYKMLEVSNRYNSNRHSFLVNYVMENIDEIIDELLVKLLHVE